VCAGELYLDTTRFFGKLESTDGARKTKNMPTAIKQLPKPLQPFFAHGVDLDYQKEQEETVGICPFCGKENKFYVNSDTGLWSCRVCAQGTVNGGGNIATFLAELWKASDEDTTEYADLAKQRSLLEEETLMHWGVARSILTDRWLVPGFGSDGKVRQLYQYVNTTKGKKLLATPSLGHQLFGVNLHRKNCSTVFLCEGPWDAMVLWETLGKAKGAEERIKATASTHDNLLNSCAVLAVPGCTTFFEKWTDIFADKDVFILFDNDWPKKHPKTGKLGKPVGLQGARRVTSILVAASSPPKSISYLCWGNEGYNKDLPDGYDVRDLLGFGSLPERVKALRGLLDKIRPVPEEWLKEGKQAVKAAELQPKKCVQYRKLQMAWRKALKWTPGLDHALTVMLSSIASTKLLGDPLWVKIVGPAASGKSTLCEGLSVAKKYVVAKSSITGFHSGFRVDGTTEQDHSLVALLPGKTLIVKDGDTILSAANRNQILSEARDIYDGTSRTHYRNAQSRDYHGIKMTWILCGTSSLRSIDQSELGERFLDCVIMEHIDPDLEDEVLLRTVTKTDQAMLIEADDRPSSHYDPPKAEAMALTGGYVQWLRENVGAAMPTIAFPEKQLLYCAKLGKFVAYMRARPSQSQEETAEREFATRLAGQLVRLARCLAFVLNKQRVDSAVMRRVRRVALDTSRGKTLAIAAYLYKAGREGSERRALALVSNTADNRAGDLLRFLREIGVVQTVQRTRGHRAGPTRYRLTKRLRALYREVQEED